MGASGVEAGPVGLEAETVRTDAGKAGRSSLEPTCSLVQRWGVRRGRAGLVKPLEAFQGEHLGRRSWQRGRADGAVGAQWACGSRRDWRLALQVSPWRRGIMRVPVGAFPLQEAWGLALSLGLLSFWPWDLVLVS